MGSSICFRNTNLYHKYHPCSRKFTPPQKFHESVIFSNNKTGKTSDPSSGIKDIHGDQVLVLHHHHSRPCSPSGNDLPTYTRRSRGRESFCGSTDDPKKTEPEGDDESRKALGIVLQLYLAIKRRDLHQISDLLFEECRCMSNFVSAGFKPLHGKQQVLGFFSSLMRSFGDSFEFVVEPISLDGMNIGVRWKLECSKTHAPLGSGISFYTCHEYKGKIVIRNMEIFMQPLLHMEPVRLKCMSVAATIVDALGIYRLFNVLHAAKRAACILISLVLLIVMVALLFLLRHSSK